MLRLKLYWNEKCAYQGPNFLQDEIIDCERHRILNDFVLVSKAIGQTRKYKTEWNSPRGCSRCIKRGSNCTSLNGPLNWLWKQWDNRTHNNPNPQQKRKSFCHFYEAFDKLKMIQDTVTNCGRSKYLIDLPTRMYTLIHEISILLISPIPHKNH